MIKLVEICELLNASNKSRQRYTLREIYVNPKHIVALRDEASFKQKLSEGVLPAELDERQQFTRVTLNKGQTGLEIIVIGAPNMIERKLLQGQQGDILFG